MSAALAAASFLAAAAWGGAQPTGASPLNPPPNSPKRADSTWHAITNATVHVRPGRTLHNATVVFRDGIIIAVEPGPAEPEAPRPELPAAARGARIWDGTGLHVYPGFIDAHVDVDAPVPDASAPGVHWNNRVMPQRSALDGTGVDERTADSLRRLGFTAAAIAPRGGVFRGSAAVVSLAKPASETSADRPPVYRERAYQGVAFDTTRRGGRGDDPDVTRWSSYPNSQMGAIALIRQTLIDADWQGQARRSGGFIAANALDHLAMPADGAITQRTGMRGHPEELQRILDDGVLEAALGARRQDTPRDLAPAAPQQVEPSRSGQGYGMPSPRPRSAAPAAADAPVPAATQPQGSAQPPRGEPPRDDRPADALRHVGPAGAHTLPLLFDSDDELEALRAARIAREFDRPAMILGSGYEFRRLEAIQADGLPIILPLRYPRTPDVAGVGKADAVELRDLMTWEQAPTNPRRLDAAGLTIALTTSKLRNRSEFEANLTRAIKHGLPPERAMAMLTTHPAQLLGVADRMGAIEVGLVANLVVADGPLFVGFSASEDDDAAAPAAESDGEQPAAEEPPAERRRGVRGPGPREDRAAGGPEPRRATRIRDVWIDGYRHEITASPVRDHVGRWQVVELDGKPLDPAAPDTIIFTITRENQITFRREGKEARASNVRIQDRRLDFTIEGTMLGIEAMLLESAVVEGDMIHGTTALPTGALHRWSARRIEDEAPPQRQREEAGPAAPAAPAPDTFAGTWHVSMEDQPDEEVTIEIAPDNAVTIFFGGQPLVAREIQIEGDSISFRFDTAPIGIEGMTQVHAVRDGNTLRGTADTPGLPELAFTAQREPPAPQPEPQAAPERRGRGQPARPAREAEKDEREAIAEIPEGYGYPFGPYMIKRVPPQEAVLFINATIWTAGQQGIIEDGWMFIRDGRIAALGSGGPPGRAGDVTVVDLGGRHIAPGIIDCHSHTGISRGVNESGQAVTAEVRIGDVTNPDAISWYRQLASGVTAVNSLHGSANAIGGQSQTNKIRWGVRHPDDMHMEGAMRGIKFALGENVKQSNWGDRNTVRYPQTRMGVEMLIRDRFKAAREYRARMELWRSRLDSDAAVAEAMGTMQQGDPTFITTRYQRDVMSGRAVRLDMPPRRDLELEALAEVLGGERLVHCHSYRQDEILMLCRVAGEFGFRIGTFQHILEGYKVADEIARHALGASAFSDWWAYKVEVQDAIPQAGPIMWEEGLVVSFNSDSDELARRMNGEAAKAIKYAAPQRPIEPNEALKFVTLNAAIQLGVADRIGSLEVGKDADFAIWSGPPLSSFSRCEATYVDGRRLFALEDDAAHREFIQRERQRIIQKILAEHRRRPAGQRREERDETPAPAAEDSRRGMMRAYYLDLINRGIDPSAARPGDCGCDELEFHWH
jgi:imidazolonepropionase-like amidohydrolase